MVEKLDWKRLYAGHIMASEVRMYIPQLAWQEVRLLMKGKSLHTKYQKLDDWLEKNNHSRAAQVQVTNYITALSRGGLIKPGEYRD